MLRIYLLLKKYMVLIYLLLKKHIILIIFLLNEKGIKDEDDKNLPPIEEIQGLDNLTHVVKVNSLYRFDKCEIPFTKFASPCLDEFDDFMVKQENFNAYVSRQLKRNAFILG